MVEPNAIMGAITTATRKAPRAAPDERKLSMKGVIYREH
jgi:hypothetical protein